MFVEHLQLTDFRSYAGVDVPLDAGVTTFVGANGQGKTNLVEAVEYLATLGSHRVATDAPLVRAGAERAVLRARSRDDACVPQRNVETPGGERVEREGEGRAALARAYVGEARLPRRDLGLEARENLLVVLGLLLRGREHAAGGSARGRTLWNQRGHHDIRKFREKCDDT